MVKKIIVLFAVSIAVMATFFYGLEQVGIRAPLLIGTALLAMTPLAFAAVGECINEKAGTINIGLEGILLLTGLFGVFGAEFFENWVGGLLFGVLAGTLLGLAHGILSVYGRANQIIAGMGLNIVALGFVPFFLMTKWGLPGLRVLRPELHMPTWHTWLGPICPLVIVAIIVAVLAFVLLNKTLLGVRIKAAGEKPESVDVAGVGVDRIRILTCTLGGALCGFGGAFMVLGWFGAITIGMPAGRGFIALACVVAARMRPLLALAIAFLFGLMEALAHWVAITPGVKEVVPFYWVMTLPYIATIVIVTIFMGKAIFPRAIGKPYVRE